MAGAGGKKLNYQLIVVFIIVWGLVIYVFRTMRGDDDEQPAAPVAKKEAYNDYAIPVDTTKLQLNYPDPFGQTAAKDTSKAVVSKTVHRNSLVVKPSIIPFNWGFITYSGYIKNADSRKLLAIVSINGKRELLAEGESAEGVKLLRNQRDSIRISYQGKTKFIVLK